MRFSNTIAIAALLAASCHPATTPADHVTARSSPSAGSGSQGFVIPKPIEIDGSQHPEMIPDWAAWDSTYSQLKMVRDDTNSPERRSLGMTQDELARVFREVDAQLARRDANAAAAARIAKEMRAKGASLAEILEVQKGPILEFRKQTLAASDRLLADLRPGARRSLAALVEQTRRGLTVSVFDTDLRFFRQPR